MVWVGVAIAWGEGSWGDIDQNMHACSITDCLARSKYPYMKCVLPPPLPPLHDTDALADTHFRVTEYWDVASVARLTSYAKHARCRDPRVKPDFCVCDASAASE